MCSWPFLESELCLWPLTCGFVGRTGARDGGSASAVESCHELAVDLAGGFEFVVAPAEGLLCVEECLLELGGLSGGRRGVERADLAENVTSDELAEAAAKRRELGVEPVVPCAGVLEVCRQRRCRGAATRGTGAGVVVGDLRGPAGELGAELGVVVDEAPADLGAAGNGRDAGRLAGGGHGLESRQYPCRLGVGVGPAETGQPVAGLSHGGRRVRLHARSWGRGSGHPGGQDRGTGPGRWHRERRGWCGRW